MKGRIIVISLVAAFIFSLMGIFTLPAIAADTYKLDPDHTSIVFRVMHLGVGKLKMESGDTLVVYTDGVIDAQNKSAQAFSKEQLTAIFENPPPSTRALVDTILERINEHISDQSQFDDITILALSRMT